MTLNPNDHCAKIQYILAPNLKKESFSTTILLLGLHIRKKQIDLCNATYLLDI